MVAAAGCGLTLDLDPPPDAALPPDAHREVDAGQTSDAGTRMCVPAVESCNGRDDDCDDSIDEEACAGCERKAEGRLVYLFCSDSTLDWPEANAACRRRGYEMVTLETAAETDLVTEAAFAVVDGDWWIGLNDREVEGDFVWASGIEADFSRWSHEQPNNDQRQEHCVAIVNGSEPWEDRGDWNDARCDAGVMGYICELSD